MRPTIFRNKRIRNAMMAILGLVLCFGLILLTSGHGNGSKAGHQGRKIPIQTPGGQQAGIKRTDLLRHDLSIPGREVVQVRVDFDPGVAFGKHSHPGEEIAYVLEGSLEYQVDGKPTVTLKAGDVLYIPAGTIHAAKNVGSGNGAELATYIVEKGKPLVVMDK